MLACWPWLVLSLLLCSFVVSGTLNLRYCGAEPGQEKPIPAPPAGATLVQVVGVYRHGDRIPAYPGACWANDTAVYSCTMEINTAPSLDSYEKATPSGRLYRTKVMDGRNDFAGDCLVGQLTDKGWNQELGNGGVYKEAYVDSGFLSNTLLDSEVWLRSDWEERTFMSAQAISLGMYPPKQTDEPQVFDIHTMDPNYDNIAPNPELCPRWKLYVDEFYASPQFVQFYKDTIDPILKNLSAQVGYPVTSDTLQHLHDCMNVHACHGFSMPWTEDQFYDVDYILNWGYYQLYLYPNRTANAQAGIGFLLKEIHQWLSEAVAGQKTYKLLLYGAHDTTVMPILAAFGVWDGLWAPYASGVTFELYKQGASFAVRLIYDGEVQSIPGCNGELCEFQQFSQIVSQLVPPDDWQQFCQVPTHSLGLRTRY